MFENTLNLVHSLKESDGTLLGATVTVPTAHLRTDGGRSFRASGNGVNLLSIGHAASKENPGFLTQRSVIRLERVIPVAESDRSVKAVVQFGFSVVKAETSVHVLRCMIVQLLNLMTFGSNANETNQLAGLETGGVRNGCDRLYAGEP